MARQFDWSRGGNLHPFILRAELTDHREEPLLASDVTAMTCLVAQLTTSEPPVALGVRSAVAMDYDSVRDEWGCTLPWGTDLDALPAVRVVITVTTGSLSHRVMDATAVFSAAVGL